MAQCDAELMGQATQHGLLLTGESLPGLGFQLLDPDNVGLDKAFSLVGQNGPLAALIVFQGLQPNQS